MPKPRLSRWVVSSYETEADMNAEHEALSPLVAVVGLKADAEILVVTSSIRVDAALLDQAPSARLVITTTSGHDHLDLAALRSRNIAACRLPMVRRDAVVESALGMILEGLRCNDDYREAAAEGAWIRHRMPALSPKTITGARIGVVGFGVIGARMYEVLQALGAEVWGQDPAGIPAGVRSADLVEMVQHCDAVSLHCRLTDDNRGMINGPLLARARSDLVLVNTARGGLLDVDAAVSALDNGQLRFLGVDVFPEEPWPRLAAAARPGVLFTPHASGYHVGLPRMVREGLSAVVGAWVSRAALPWQLLGSDGSA